MKLTEYIAITLNEKTCLSVCRRRQCPTEGGRPVGDRAARPVEQRNQEAQIRTLLDKQKEQILAECQARNNGHEFQAARAEEEQRLFQGQLLQQKLEISVRLIKEVSQKWKN